MTIDEHRMRVATLMRELGHDFVVSELDETQLDQISAHLEELHRIVAQGGRRTRVVANGALGKF
ncbi:MAG: hypothetical protein ABSG09_09145, partial [Acidimicrobiales bacterium]